MRRVLCLRKSALVFERRVLDLYVASERAIVIEWIHDVPHRMIGLMMLKLTTSKLKMGFNLTMFAVGGIFAIQYCATLLPVHSIGLNRNSTSHYRLDPYVSPDLVVNPVSMSIDDSGKLFVTQTNRITIDAISPNRIGLSNREDLMMNSVQDRVDTLKRIAGDQLSAWSTVSESIRVFEDQNNDGKADRSVVYADYFNDLADMIGAGIVTKDDEVYFTCSPNLWKLKRELTPEGRTELHRKVLITGFSPRFSGVGHGLHGLIWGPDGKLYFTVGDSGMNVKTKDASIRMVDSGAVLRCEPDGSQLEIVATGLRNPEELAFNQFGDLFTADNDQDPGDQTRWIHIVEGGDYGWRNGILPLNKSPWLREKLWTPYWSGQPAYIVPPVAILPTNLGPCGLTYYPGIGFPKEFNDTFFLCNFGYSEAESGVQTIQVKSKGASYEMIHFRNLIQGLVPTDVEFSWKGEMYISRWEEGGHPSNNGRIERLWYPEYVRPESSLKNTVLSRAVVDRESIGKLIELLASDDQRVRFRAQYRLVDFDEAIKPLIDVARKSTNRIARIHAIWALERMNRRKPDILGFLVELLHDRDSEIRSQIARALGNGGVRSALDSLISSLNDDEPRVQFQAAIALGKLGDKKGFEPIIQLIKHNADRDPVLRHATIMGLSGIADWDKMDQNASNSNASVRLAILLTYRRLKSKNVDRFLTDPNQFIKVEASRAVVDVPIPSAAPRLAELLNEQSQPDGLIRRSLAACNLIGGDDDMRRIALFAARTDVDDAYRVEAIELLRNWFKPDPFNIVTGTRQDVKPRTSIGGYSIIRSIIPSFVQKPTDAIARATISLIESTGFIDDGNILEQLAKNDDLTVETRRDALRLMTKSKNNQTKLQIKKLIYDDNPFIKVEAVRFLIDDQLQYAVQVLRELTNHPLVQVRQKAWEVLGDVPGNVADEMLIQGLDDLVKGRIDVAMEIEIVESAKKRTSTLVSFALKRYYSERLLLNDPVQSRRSALRGGNAIQGEAIFTNGSGETACPRCHSIQYRVTGGHVGPDLAGLGLRHDRHYILESLVAPGRVVSKGYESTVLALSDGRIISGVIQREDDTELILLVDGRSIKVLKNDIEDRKAGKSAMPEDITKNYSDRDLRDLVEFLSSLGTESNAWSKFGRFTEGLPKRTLMDIYRSGLR